MHYKILKKLAKLEPTNPLAEHGLALLLLVAMVVIEILTPTAVSPLISVLCFGFFAYKFRPWSVAVWVVVFAFARLYFLLQPEQPGVPVDLANAYIRFGSILIVGVGAVILSNNRIRMAESLLQSVNILEKLPVPIIVSDAHGCVLFMNNDALTLLDTTADAVRGASYFSFVSAEEKGRTVQRYLDFVDSKEPVLHDMVIQLKKPVLRTTEATIVAVEGKNAKLLATVLAPHLKKPDAPAKE